MLRQMVGWHLTPARYLRGAAWSRDHTPRWLVLLAPRPLRAAPRVVRALVKWQTLAAQGARWPWSWR